VNTRPEPNSGTHSSFWAARTNVPKPGPLPAFPPSNFVDAAVLGVHSCHPCAERRRLDKTAQGIRKIFPMLTRFLGFLNSSLADPPVFILNPNPNPNRIVRLSYGGGSDEKLHPPQHDRRQQSIANIIQFSSPSPRLDGPVLLASSTTVAAWRTLLGIRRGLVSGRG